MAAVLAVSLLTALPAGADDGTSRPKSRERVVSGHRLKAKPRTPDPATKGGRTPAKISWPSPGAVEVTVPAPGQRKGARAGGLPVSVTAPGKDAASRSAGAVRVRMLDRTAAQRAGVEGVMFTVGRTDSDIRSGQVGVSVDYSGFAQAYGGSYGSRLRLVRLPACALTSPQRPECRTATPLASRNNTETRTLTAETDAAPDTAAYAEQMTVLAAAAGTSGDNGDYKATSLSPSATWKAGTSTGEFSWSYPMRVPPVPGGLTPDVAISYSSASVDGRTSNTGNQPSWIGEGFDLWPGYIQRNYKACEDDGAPKDEFGNSPADQCWGYDNAAITFGGKGGELIPEGNDRWRIKDDDGTRVEHLTSGSIDNGDNDGEYWKVTTTDGTRFYFGHNKLPGWSTGKTETKSAWTMPVYGDDDNEPCHGATFADSSCQQAWRWNLDYVVDPRGNAISYYYTQEINHYGRNLKATDETPYVRGGYLDHIEYGLRSTDLFANAPARVDFTVSERCIPDSGFDCDPSKIAANPDRWWDVPWDLHCDSGQDCEDPHGAVAPTFWSRKRLTTVTTRILKPDASGYDDVESWKLDHDWGLADADRDLLLKTIQHTGLVGDAPVSLPPVTFNHVQLANRVDEIGDDISSFIRYRLGAIFDESGGTIDINYSDEDCTVGDTPTPETNTRRCYPVYWQPPGRDDPIQDWFHKYVVEQVVQTDRTGYSPDMVINYDYQGGAAWHYDDDDGLTKEKYKTWSQWRGYGHVQVQQGGWDAMVSQSDHYFFRGMDGDRLNASGGEKNVTVSDGEGGTPIPDHDALAGFELKNITYDAPDGNIVTKTITTPWQHQTASRTRSWGTVTANLTDVKSTRTLTALDGGAERETLVTNDYETTAGLKTKVDDQGDTAVATDDRCVTTEYASNTTDWLLNYPSQIRTVAVKCADTPDLSTELISDVRTYYDNLAWDAAPTAGRVTTTEKAKSATSGTVTYLTDATTTYDAYGRPLTVTDALGNTTTTAYTDTQGLATGITVTTPPATPGVPTSTLETSQVIDPAFGLPTRKTDAGDKITNLEYDALGRSAKVWLPTRNTSQTPNLEFTYKVVDGEIIAVATKSLRNDSTQGIGYTLYDGWLRERQTQVPATAGGRLISDTFYNTQGEVAKKYAAYYAPGAPETALFGVDTPGDVETQNVYTYDGLGRVTTERLMVGNGDTQEKWRTTTSYGGNWTAVTPPAGGTPTTTITDARGQTVELRQHKGTGPGNYDSTFYEYHPTGQLAKITAPGNQVWTYTYDVRGRKIQDDDPDKGTVKYTYDDLDRLTQTEDARGKKITTAYDGLGRKIGLYDSTSATPGTQLAGWVYDTLRKGQLTSSTRFVGALSYTSAVTSYDNLNRPLRTTYTIPSVTGEDKLAGSYVFGASYNVDNTLAGTSYPTGGDLAAESVPITYDTENLQRPIALGTGTDQYVTNTTYTLTGKPEQYRLSTGGKWAQITQTWEYGTQRLASSRTEREGTAGVDRSATYSYDDAGNVKQINETSRSGTDNQCFRYDYLQRLTEAWAQGTATCAADAASATIGGPAGYKQTFTYDAAGNRATDTRTDATGSYTRTYTAPTTGHRLPGLTQTGTSAHTESYGYDASGNTTSRNLGATSQTLTWDNEGELAKISDSAKGDTTFQYDADGNRLLRRDPTGTTLYLPGMEIRQAKGATNATATRYYTYGDQTIAMRTAASVQFLSADHHDTTELQINATTQALTQRRFTPFGQTRGTATGTWTGDKGFVGGTTDTSTALTHLGAREYDPLTGRFISVDPLLNLEFPQGYNGYSYANHNPVTISDPTGLDGPLKGNKDCYYAGKGCLKTKPPKKTTSNSPTYPNGFPNVPRGPMRQGTIHQMLQGMREGMRDANDYNRYMQAKTAFCAEYPGDSTCKAGNVHDDLDRLGLIPGLGTTADLMNTAIYADEGNWGMAALSMAGAVPGIGDVLIGGKVIKRALRAGRACSSFVPGTKVLLSDGERKSIEEIDVGDQVIATNPETGQTQVKDVLATITSKGNKKLVEVTIDTDGARGSKTGLVIATDQHPFWVAGDLNKWINAGNLEPGMWLRTSAGTYVQIAAIKTWTRHQRVHNLTIADTHTYYVEAGDTPVLVHNAGPGCGDPVRILAGQQAAGGSYKLSNAELSFVKNLLGRKPNFQVFRNDGHGSMGDFLVVDRSNPRSPVGWVVELKSSSGGFPGEQFRNAASLQSKFGLSQMRMVAGTPDEMLEALSVGRGSWN